MMPTPSLGLPRQRIKSPQIPQKRRARLPSFLTQLGGPLRSTVVNQGGGGGGLLAHSLWTACTVGTVQ